VGITTQVAAASETKKGPLALWHLLSLDAPTVAAVWTWFLARANHVHLPVASPVAMALAVWMLYAADRLLDARGLGAAGYSLARGAELEERHFFHHCHRQGFLIGIAFAAVALAGLLSRLDAVALRLYSAEGLVLCGWFVLLHATRSAHRLPKEIAVGLFFAAATFIPTVARRPDLRTTLLPDALLFAALCSLNCLFLYAWEHEGNRRPLSPAAHVSTRLALRHLTALAAAVAIAGVGLGVVEQAGDWPVPVACSAAAALLVALDRTRRNLRELTLRAAADLALLTPLALLPLLR
jgi:hypothetical protein